MVEGFEDVFVGCGCRYVDLQVVFVPSHCDGVRVAPHGDAHQTDVGIVKFLSGEKHYCALSFVDAPQQFCTEGIGKMVVEALHDADAERCLTEDDGRPLRKGYGTAVDAESIF